MTPELKAKWIADLKTHAKAVGVLRDHDDRGLSYCCLGVACLTLGASFAERGTFNAPRLPDGTAINDGEGLSALGLTMLGISEKAHDELIRLNDESDTFEPVIAYIEANL